MKSRQSKHGCIVLRKSSEPAIRAAMTRAGMAIEYYTRNAARVMERTAFGLGWARAGLELG